MYKLIIAFLISINLFSQEILSEKNRAEVVNSILKDRLNNLLPDLMDESEIDMWILISREYNEDPVLKTMLPAEWLNARRRTIILFYRDKKNNTIDKLAVARYNFGDNIISAWDKQTQPIQWERLVELIKERNPEKIGLNFSKDFNISDGLDKTDFDEFMQVLPENYQNKIVSAETLSNLWIETRTEYEMELYEDVISITHNIISEAFSNSVIKPGLTIVPVTLITPSGVFTSGISPNTRPRGIHPKLIKIIFSEPVSENGIKSSYPACPRRIRLSRIILFEASSIPVTTTRLYSISFEELISVLRSKISFVCIRLKRNSNASLCSAL